MDFFKQSDDYFKDRLTTITNAIVASATLTQVTRKFYLERVEHWITEIHANCELYEQPLVHPYTSKHDYLKHHHNEKQFLDLVLLALGD